MANLVMFTEKTKHRGWQCKSPVPLGGNKELMLATYKDDNGRLNTYASVHTKDPNNPGFVTFRIYGDFHRVVASSKPPRVSAAICEGQHREVFYNLLDDIKTQVAAFYANKGEPL